MRRRPWLALALLAGCCGPGGAKKFDLQGRCAAVVNSAQWSEATKGGDRVSRWDLKIKVDPWTFFGRVNVGLTGNGVTIDSIYGAVGSTGGARSSLLLDAQPAGADQTLEMLGSGLLVGEPQLSVWREQAWEKIGASPSDRSTWPPAPPGGGQLPNIMGVEPSLGAVPEIASVVEQLGGGAFEGGGSMLKAIFPAEFPLPDGATEWHRPNGQHIDGVSQPTPSPAPHPARC